MELIPLPGNDGRVTMWVRAQHVAVIVRIDQRTGDGVQVRADLKVEGMPLIRVNIADVADAAAADEAWAGFLAHFDQ